MARRRRPTAPGNRPAGLDRLAGLMWVISADVVREALWDTDRANETLVVCCRTR